MMKTKFALRVSRRTLRSNLSTKAEAVFIRKSTNE